MCELSNGISKRGADSGTSTIVLRLADLDDEQISLSSPRLINLAEKEIEQYKLEKGDLLFVRVNGSKPNVGKTYIFDKNETVAFCDHLMRGRVSFALDSNYLRLALRSSFCRTAINNLIVTTAGQNTISQTSLNSIVFPLPPLAEQKRIASTIEAAYAVIDEIDSNKSGLFAAVTAAKSKVLSLAISGKLVPQDPNDEPASILLERIQVERAALAGKGKVKKVAAAPAVKTADNSHYGDLPASWAEIILDEVLEYQQPTEYIVESVDYDDSYETPVLTAGKSFIIGYTDEKTGICKKLPVIIFDDFTTDSKFVDFPFKVKSSAMKILRANHVEIKFFYYLMQTIKCNSSTHKRYWISEYSQKIVPLPPLAEQKRIVEAIEKAFLQLDEISRVLI